MMPAAKTFRRFRQQGCGADEAAALMGYALLAQRVGWKRLGLSHHQRRRTQRVFVKAGIDPMTIDFGCLPNNHGKSKEKRQGVLTSGVVHHG